MNSDVSDSTSKCWACDHVTDIISRTMALIALCSRFEVVKITAFKYRLALIPVGMGTKNGIYSRYGCVKWLLGKYTTTIDLRQAGDGSPSVRIIRTTPQTSHNYQETSGSRMIVYRPMFFCHYLSKSAQ